MLHELHGYCGNYILCDMRIWCHVIALTTTAAVLVACGPVIPSSDGHENEQQPAVASFAGSYRATSTRTQVNLEVNAESFTAVTVTESQARGTTVQANSVQYANANNAPTAVWVVFTGDVTSSGSSVTVSITGVERDGQALKDDELETYTSCEITATAGDGFDDAVMAGIFECLGATDVEINRITVNPYAEQDPPSKLIIGAWKHDDPGSVEQAVDTMVISANALEIDLSSGGQQCDPYDHRECIVVWSVKSRIDDISETGIVRGEILGGVEEKDGTRVPFDALAGRRYFHDSERYAYTVDAAGDGMSIRTEFGSAKLSRIR